MNDQIKELIAIGSSIAAHCRPCLEHHVGKAREMEISEDDIIEAVHIGNMVQKGGMKDMKTFSDRMLQPIDEED